MAGLIILAALCAYAVFSIIVVVTVALVAGKKGRSALKWGIGAAVVMYHLVFWDLIPTWVVYKYYCITKAGFWVYKTPEQWKAENPGVAETLTWSKNTTKYYYDNNITTGYYLNERIVWTDKITNISFIPVRFKEHIIMDLKNKEILVKQISVGAGDSGTEFTRFWTHIESYMPNNYEFNSYNNQFRKLGREVK